MGEGSARPIVLVGQLDNCMFNEGEEKKKQYYRGIEQQNRGVNREPLPFQWGLSSYRKNDLKPVDS